MAERFGGKYSPGSASGPSLPGKPRRHPAGARVNFLFVVPFLLILSAFQQEPVGMALDLVAFGDLMLAAWLTREGLVAEDAYNARRVAKRPAIPRKMFASLLTGSGVALAGINPETFGLLEPALYFVLGAALHFFSFGPDPMKDKGTQGMDVIFFVHELPKRLGEYIYRQFTRGTRFGANSSFLHKISPHVLIRKERTDKSW